MTIEVGTRHFYRGRTYIAKERELRPDKGTVLNKHTGRYEPEHYLCMIPEDRAPTKPSIWTDWIPESHVEVHFTPLTGDEQPEVEARTTHVEAAVAEARAKPVRAALTPKKRLQNRITSTRYKLKHPEKNGRSEWSGAEVAEMERAIAEAKAEIEALA